MGRSPTACISWDSSESCFLRVFWLLGAHDGQKARGMSICREALRPPRRNKQWPVNQASSLHASRWWRGRTSRMQHCGPAARKRCSCEKMGGRLSKHRVLQAQLSGPLVARAVCWYTMKTAEGPEPWVAGGRRWCRATWFLSTGCCSSQDRRVFHHSSNLSSMAAVVVRA